MAKLVVADDVGKSAKPPGKPPRRFPWRLWLYALLMTGVAGAGGYFTWHFREQAETATDSGRAAHDQKAADDKQITDKTKEAADCKTAKDALAKDSAALKTQQETLSKNLNASKEQLASLTVQVEQAKERQKAIDEIQKQFAKMIDTGTLKITARRGSLVISLPAEVLFPSGVADLSEEGKVKVHEIGFTLKSEQFKDRRFLVVGHSDNQPLKNSTYKDNWELSAARALTVTRNLVQAGMEPKNLIAAGAGENDPVAPNSSVKDLARNRRIEIQLLPAINELPPLPTSLTEKGTDKGSEKPSEKPDPKKPEPKKP